MKTSENGRHDRKGKTGKRKKNRRRLGKIAEKQSTRTEIALLCTAIVVFKESSALTTIRKTAGTGQIYNLKKRLSRGKGKKDE
ncbi:hypothetical protein [uncultured Alistipes sp.]|uniref:hypothetical protein n=1 Tax=uncultured Alistipes sp. TaxID=538949 RepID=UPI0025934360|nr:hypothetical protein [uncultured Alistipes sp.]